jgi:hypothetical protein
MVAGLASGSQKQTQRGCQLSDDWNKWQVEGWGAAQGQIRAAMLFLCADKDHAERLQIGEELVQVIRAMAWGERPPEQTTVLHDGRDEHLREVWARMTAEQVVGGALVASERAPSTGLPPSPDQQALLREIARAALWHMHDAPGEARMLVRAMEIERLKQPHPAD